MSGTIEGLRGRRILVAEDEYFIADELAEVLGAAGAEVRGPVSTVAEALEGACSEERLDGAILDVNLSGRMVWPVVDALTARGVPIVLATGYDAGVVPPAHAHLPRCEKPAEAPSPSPSLVGSPPRREPRVGPRASAPPRDRQAQGRPAPTNP